MTTKPTPEQRKIINAVEWCMAHADYYRSSDVNYEIGKHEAYLNCARHFNNKLPKELRVKL